MKQKAKLIYKSDKQGENELIPSQYYGMPNGDVYRISYYSWDNEGQFELEKLKDLKYDYENGKLLGWRLFNKKLKKYTWWPMLDNKFIDRGYKVRTTQYLDGSITTIDKALAILNRSIHETVAVVKQIKSPKSNKS